MRKLNNSRSSSLLKSFSVAVLIFVIMACLAQLPKKINDLTIKAAKINKYKLLSESVLGLKGKKNILLLFMNNAEQRYAGGFIGSVGYVTVDGGKIKADPVRSVYYYDRKFEEVRYIEKSADPTEGDVLYTLRDSGQSLDWTLNGKRAKTIFEKESGKKVDIVVGITPDILKYLLKKTGPIYLNEYDKTISYDNIIETLQSEVEYGQDKIDGKDPKTILSVLSNKLIERFSSQNLNQLISFGSDMKELADKRQVVIYSPSFELASLLKDLKYDGSLVNFVSDYFMIAEKNVSVDKSNAFIERQLERKVHLNSDGKMDVDIKISRKQIIPESFPYIDPKDAAANPTFLVKKNKSFVKFALPKGSKIDQSKTDVQVQERGNEGGYDIYWFESNLEPLVSSVYNISYSLPFKVVGTDTVNIDSYLQIQNGAWPYQLTNVLYMPKDWNLVASNKRELEVDSNSIKYVNKMVDRDVFMSSVFAKK